MKIANAQLKKFDQAKSDFVSIAAHQLRAPVTGFRGYLSMLLEGDFGKLNSEQKRIIKLNLNNIERMVSLIDLFLDITKIEAGRLTLTKEKVQIEDLIRESLESLKFSAQRKNLYLEFREPEKKLPEIKIDSKRIKDVILNLVDNAIKYTEKGGVKVFAEKNNNEILVSVRDTGIGIPKEEVKLLFKKFVRGDRAVLNPSGSGLGLFIVKKIIEAHGGKVMVESEGEGKGSTFSFSLPIK